MYIDAATEPLLAGRVSQPQYANIENRLSRYQITELIIGQGFLIPLPPAMPH